MLFHLLRLACDRGEWTCTLTKRRMPADWLDDAVEASGEALPVAILTVVLEARRPHAGDRAAPCDDANGGRDRDTDTPCCCDNFG